MRRNFFTQRVVNVWNSLPQNAVEVKANFKKKLDITLGAKGIKGYGGKGGIRILNSMISHDQNEWWSRLEGLNDLLLLLVSIAGILPPRPPWNWSGQGADNGNVVDLRRGFSSLAQVRL